MGRSVRLRDDLKSPWLLSIIGIIVITLMVNVGLAVAAVMSSPGLVVDNYYERGQSHFRDEVKEKRIEAIGMRLRILTPPRILLGKSQIFRFSVTNADGSPVRDGRATMLVFRPSDANQDFQVKLPISSAGVFSASMLFDSPGIWDLIAKVKTNGNTFDVAKRINVYK